MTADRLLNVEVHDQYMVVTVLAEIDLSNAEGFAAEIRQAFNRDLAGLAVDLTEIRYLDSAGIRVLFDVARDLRLGRQLMGVVVDEDAPLSRLLDTTRVEEVAIVANSVKQCIEAFADAAPWGVL